MLRLYHVPLSPFCRKVRLVLAEKKMDVELIEERYWEQSTEFLRRNPAGQGSYPAAPRGAFDRKHAYLRVYRRVKPRTLINSQGRRGAV